MFSKKVQDKKDKPVIVSSNGQKVVVEKDSEEYEKYRDIIEKVADSKINEACDTAKEHVIQAEIEKRIKLRIDKKADEKSHIKDVLDTNNKEVHSVYMKEVERLTVLYKAKQGDTKEDKNGHEDEKEQEERIKHEARVKALYYIKEQEIREITKDIVPIFFLANISDNREDNSMVYYRSTGEAIYRYYYNRLNGLKKGNGYEEKLEPQEQQKKALLKLTGLFEEDEENFFIYDKKKNVRIDLNEAVPAIGEER